MDGLDFCALGFGVGNTGKDPKEKDICRYDTKHDASLVLYGDTVNNIINNSTI